MPASLPEATCVLLALLARPGGGVDYARDVAPLLEARCFSCHAGDRPKGGLRLDARGRALRGGNSGERAIVPGKPEKSRLLALVKGSEPGPDGKALAMPPRGERLAPEEIATLERWIAEGAPWPDELSGDELVREHWSFVKPRTPPLPELGGAHASWPRNEIDAFTLAKMEEHALAPSAEADRATLARRLALDLTGLPPSPEEVASFVDDRAPDAYERLVRRLLDSPRYGERWARMWLDLARFADSTGYGQDNLRPFLWRWRDWVIDAFNRNQRFDQFTIEQLAGDLLPQPTLDQLLATAFHRNTMTNVEGGTVDEEFRVAAVKDRVDATMQIWMGLTFGCAKCHSHKFDPLPQKDYYRFFAFFNQTEDADRADEEPRIATPTPEQAARREELVRKIEASRHRAPGPAPARAARWLRIELPGKERILSLAEVEAFAGGEDVARAGTATQSSVDFDGPPALAIDGNRDGRYREAKSTTHTRSEDDPWWELDLGASRPIERVAIWNRVDDGLHVRLAGARVQLLAESATASGGRELVWEAALKDGPDPAVAFDANGAAVVVEEAELAKLDREIVRTPILRELPREKRRATHLLVKSNWLVPGEEVEAAVPAAFPPLPDDAPRDRLGVARWLVSPDNPLTARVTVNRFWAQLFGRGLVETEEDFGTQGTPPSHPELLDWLACRFVASGWDVKELLFTIVTSATYRQASARDGADRDARDRGDPQNLWLSRFPRRRLEAETVRDQALSIAGLLSPKLHGPSVFPPQPDGIWQVAFNGERDYPTSRGEERWRRGLYTFWRRTVPPPAMQAFDAPSREFCAIRRQATNTPLQALVTLNDPCFVEAAQALARRIVRETKGAPDAKSGIATTEERAAFALQLALARPPRREEVAILAALFERRRAELARDPDAARTLAEQPLGPLPADLGATAIVELAAWTAVANVVLNLDALLVKG